MTNPDNIIRLHSRTGGRGSVYEANAPYQVYSMGMLYGTGVVQNTSPDMNIIVGGADGDISVASPSNPHIVKGLNPQGYSIMMDIVGTTVLTVTAPATNSRRTAVVVYTNDLSESSTDASTTGSPSQNGIILVNGPAAASPRNPNESEIRQAITDDGGTGTQAVYAIIATMQISSNTTTITNDTITRWHSYLNNNVVSDDIARQSDVDNLAKVKSASFAGGFGKTIIATRVGNIVTAASAGGSSFSNAGEWTKLNEKCPAGYRPANDNHGIMVGACPGTANPCIQTIAHDGTMTQMVMNQNSSTDYRMTGAWYTTDAWPS